jgi:CRP-like cAMP-binding protein
MAKDVRELREEAAEATAAGKHKRALAAYLELERIDPRDAQWAKRAGESYRRLGNTKLAIEAFNRSAERYAQNGFLVQAIAVCKLVLQIDPQHADTLRRLSTMNEQVGQGPTRAGTLAEHNPALAEDANVAAIRLHSGTNSPNVARTSTSQSWPQVSRTATSSSMPPPAVSPTSTADWLPPLGPASTGTTPPPNQHDSQPPSNARTRTVSSVPPGVATSRTKSKPIALIPGAALETVQLSKEVPAAALRERSTPGIHVIPLEDADLEPVAPRAYDRASTPVVEVVEDADSIPIYTGVDEVPEELELHELEEIPLGEPRALGAAAARALAATPLFAGLPSDTLESIVEHLSLVSLQRGEHLFREGDPGDALYIVVEGELIVQNEGPPRVEMARLGPGSFIGEVALLTDQPRTATVTALMTSELLRIDRVTLSHVLGSHGDVLRAVLRFVRDRLVDRWMRTSPLFRPFDEDQRVELVGRFNFLEIDAGTLLLGAGARPDGLYIVLAGQFVVQRGGVAIARLGPGDLIGETALLSGGAFKSDVVSNGKSLALCLPARDFREVIMTHPHVLEYIGEQAEHSRRLSIL